MSRRSLDQEIDIVGLMCRVDFLSFIRKCFHTLSPNSEFLPNWHIDRLAYELDLVRLGQNPRLVINAPPRMLKSLICSIALPAYTSRLLASRSVMAPPRAFAQSSSVFGMVSCTPLVSTTTDTDSHTRSPAGSTMCCMISRILPTGTAAGAAAARVVTM